MEQYTNNSLTIGSPQFRRIHPAARDNKVAVFLGFFEGYNTITIPVQRHPSPPIYHSYPVGQ